MEELSSLVIAAQGGDKQAFGHIAARFQNMAYAVAYAMLGDFNLAQDAAQEAFIDAYVSLPKLQEPAAFPGWFRRVVVKHSDRQIRNRRLTSVPLEQAMAVAAETSDTAALFEARHLRQTVQEAIASLPHNQRLVTTLFYVQDYSQKEISSILELPVTTIKKQLHDARKRLKKRMIVMLQEELGENKPSRNDRFTNKVQFFIALKTGDLAQVEACLGRDPDLINAQTEWGVASEGYYWPLGVTALYWAAGVGDLKLARSLLSRGAQVNAVTKSGLTPLHFAVLMRQAEMIQLLIERGAEIDAPNSHGHTPLHLAAMRGNADLARLLLSHGAATEAVDSAGRKPLDWATNKGDTELIAIFAEHSAGGITTPAGIPPVREARLPTGADMLGRVLDGRGRPIDGSAPLKEVPQPTVQPREAAPGPSMLTTGIKIIDLLAPLRRGGHHGVFTPHPGVGKLVVLGQLIQNMASLYNGYTICMGLERGEYTAKGLLLGWRDWNVDQRCVLVFGQQGDPASKRLQVAETGLGIAENFRRQGHDVLLLVDSDLALSEGVLACLKTQATSTPQAAITTVVYGDHSLGAEPQPFTNLDALITFEVGRARQGLWPAIDPLRSRSNILKPELIGELHAQIAARVRQTLWRHLDLNAIVENRGLDALSTAEDRQVVTRARRLDHFLTQPFAGAEPWTNLPGQIVSLEDTLAGCQAILDGVYDEVPEEALSFTGALEPVTKKAKK